jgi:hypothetical protein
VVDRNTFSFYNDEDNDEHENETEDEMVEDGEAIEEHKTPREVAYVETAREDIYKTESEKRRERRHAQVAREREGDRRRREGLPRNYMLVDKISGLPYGQGVSAWRKELHLLSRKLDPAVGNINHHPPSEVKEVMEWIEQTWEYSFPINEKFVKDVIARGVSLRRSSLWRRIRTGLPKPDDITDRTWRSLEKELQNPTTMRKAELCSLANAARSNFGRTGPSGEVGVRERLRKQFRRSPEPEEIAAEMARDKGYGGRSKRRKIADNVMHGSQNERVDLGGEQLSHTSRESLEESPRNLGGPGETSTDEGLQIQEGRNSTVAPNTGSPSPVLTLTDEDIARHPTFLKLMQRLEALEGKKSQVTVEKEAMREEIDGADEISEANPLQEDLVEQNIPPLNPIAKHVQFPSPNLNLSFSVVK